MAALLILVIAWATFAIAAPASEPVKLAGLCAGLALALPMARLPRPPAALWVLALAWLPATLFTLDPASTLLGSLARAQGLIAALALLALAWCAGGLDARERPRVLAAIAVIGALLGAYALLQRAGLDPIAWSHGDPQRPAATAGNAVTLAGWLVLAIPVTLAQWRHGAMRRVALALLLALQAGGLLATGSRGAWLALASAVLLMAMLRGGPVVRRRLCWLGLPLVLLAFTLAAQRPQSVDDRIALWQAGVQALVQPPAMDWRGGIDPHAGQRWLFGHGADRQSGPLDGVFVRHEHRAETSGWRADRAHQAVIDRWLEAGLIGVLGLAVLAAAVARALWRARDDALTTWLALALLAWALHLQLAFALTADRTLAWLLIGLALQPQGQPLAPRRPNAALLPALTLLAGAFVAAGLGPSTLNPARAAEDAFREGQSLYRSALSSGASADYHDAALAFTGALAHDRHDRDAALAAASAHAEACVRGARADCAAARELLARAERLAPAEPRLPGLRVRLADAP